MVLSGVMFTFKKNISLIGKIIFLWNIKNFYSNKRTLRNLTFDWILANYHSTENITLPKLLN